MVSESLLALLGAVFYVATILMRTIVPLRVFGIIGDVFFIGYAVLAHSVTTFFMYLLLLPINGVRLYQMIKLVKKARRLRRLHADLQNRGVRCWFARTYADRQQDPRRDPPLLARIMFSVETTWAVR